MAAAKKQPAIEVVVHSDAPTREQIQELKQALSGGPPKSPLESRVEKLEQQIQALLILSAPTVLEGKAVPRCSTGCKRLATRTGVIDHPIDGRHTFSLCDSCEPSHPFAKLAIVKLTYVEDFSQESLKTIRRLNEALKCVPSL